VLADYPIFYLARLVLETRSPLSISAGRGDGTFDTVLARDANSLPALPGSSIAGVLRHLYQYNYGEQSTQALFGSGNLNQERPSQVHVSWGCIHDSHNKPVEGLILNQPYLTNDPLLSDARQMTPIIRNHVRLTDRGTASEQAQFDRTSLRAGHRFTVEISLWSDKPKNECWENLLALLNRPDFRLGGSTRRGLGALRVMSLHAGQFNLIDTKDFAAYQRLSIKLADSYNDLLQEKTLTKKRIFPRAKICLTPREGYRFGQGTEPFFMDDKADLLPVREQKVQWNEDNKGTLTDERYIVIPASGVKGALRHRVAFHYNALTGHFADLPISQGSKDTNQAVNALFGFSKDNHYGQVGHLVLDDLYLIPKPEEAFMLIHNGVDRFTGGVREHMLFNEELVGQKTPLELSLTVITHPDNSALNEPMVRNALALALLDLIEGRLALGAGGGRGGYGYFNGTIQWSDNKTWINGQ